MKTTTWTFLALILLLGFAPASFAGTATSQPTLCGAQGLDAIFTVTAQAPAASNVLFAQQVTDQQVCNPLCVTSQCSSNADCTAAPHGRCNYACPQTGCCVYQDPQ